ncbi:PREDICTED: acid-sensing ion channel 2 isoform X2 [Condylura cristata]|uniref:acid-sensing ion channel 2 isoform X2 n=1 Tax=Condylura cristata TaxID=143302 RepID=UPI0006438764|nr:PREDICTED: acid-sensing ion channel 2 isoform X2 [Condylura cristata]
MDLKESPSEGSLQPSSLQIFANTSTLHGIRHIFLYGPLTIRRVLWAVAFVGSLGLLLVESSERVSYYFSYQHVTKVDEVVAQSLVFPAVTLCNLNGFRFSRLTTNDLYHAGELLALLDVNLQIPDPHLADPMVLEALRQKANFKHYKPKQFSMLEFLHRVGHDLKDMMLYCKFKGQECGHQDFTTLTYLPPPWGECRSSEMGLDFFPVYSITACRIDCETRYIVENCNCRMVHMPGDAPFCTPEQHKECAEPALGLLAEKDSNYCLCRTPCNLTRYNKELSMVKIPSKTSAKYLEKKFNKSEKYISENILVLDIFFEALNYETIEQKKAYEVAALLGDIGGQMGLFIGASILTILELFDYIYELIKEKLLDLLGKEEDEGSHDENVSTCETMPNHSETISHTVNVPLQTALGTLEEIAC